MVLVKEGKLTLPLFHGTSSLFVKSIFKNGLGGENPIQELRVIPFLQNLCEACQRTLSGDPRWLSEKWLVDQMLSQQNPNFRHGGSFLSPSRLTAVRYAASNPFGSEVISIAAQLYKLLTEFEPRHKLDLRVTEFPIIAVLNKTPNPVLVEVSHVNISYLQGEQGQTAQQIIKELARLISSVGIEHLNVIGQQSNFRLIKPVDAHQLRLYHIKITKDDPVFPEYDLETLTRH